MTETLLALGLAAIALAYILAPIWNPRAGQEAESDAALQDAQLSKRAALNAILDIEEEHEMGKISSDDRDELRSRYELHALNAIRAVDELEGRVRSADDDLEAEIARAKRQIAGSRSTERN